MAGTPTSDALARSFCQILNNWLDDETLVEVNRRNRLPEYARCCATHDFCDPNQAMVEALGEFNLTFSPRLIGLINDAWDLASSRGFHV